MHRLREYFSMNFPNWTSAPRKSLLCPLLVIISPRPTAILMLNTTDLSIFERYVNRSLTIYILLGNKPWRQFSNRRMTQTDVSFTRTIAKNRTPSLWPHLSPLLPPPHPLPLNLPVQFHRRGLPHPTALPSWHSCGVEQWTLVPDCQDLDPNSSRTDY